MSIHHHDDVAAKFAAEVAATLDVATVDSPPTRKREREDVVVDDFVTVADVPVVPTIEPQDFVAPPPAKKPVRRKYGVQMPVKKLNQEQWDTMFERLVKYKEKHGDCLVPKRYQEDPKLGTWVETQRVQYKKLEKEIAEDGTSEAVTPNNRLNEQRLTRLEEIGFAWSAKHVRKGKQPAHLAAARAKKSPSDPASRAAARQRMNDAQWNEMYERLIRYKERYGDCLVPKKFEEDSRLASWVEYQRVLYNREMKADRDKTGLAHSPIETKGPDEWSIEIDKQATTATAEDAAEVAAMTATLEAVNGIVDDPTPAEAAALTAGVEPTSISMEEDSKMPATSVLGHERISKLDRIGFVWSLRSKRTDDHWDLMFNQLVQYRNEHGDCLVPSRYDENFKLGKWVETQRYEYTKLQRVVAGAQGPGDEQDGGLLPKNNPRLTEERRRRLESIGFEWKVKNKMKRYYDKQWDSMFQKLLQFKQDNGHCLVPKRYGPDQKLGTWVHTQRIQYRKMMQGTALSKSEGKSEEGEEQSYRLTEDRRRRLEEVGFVWSARDTEKMAEPARMTRNSYDEQWDQMFERLREYRMRNGNCLVPKRYKEFPKLGTWVDTQRVQYKKMRKFLAKEGIEYVPPRPIAADDPNPDSSAVRKPIVGRLTEDRIRRLESLGFVWSLRDDWSKHYEELMEFKRETGHCNVPARYVKNRRLGIWVSAQRQQYKLLHQQPQETDATEGVRVPSRRSAPLTQERIDLLNALGFTWTIRSRDSLGESWNQKLLELRKFKEQHGHVLVPSRYAENPELGVWVGTQRTQYRIYQDNLLGGNRHFVATSMTGDRIRQLEDLGFVWALRTGSDSLWRKRFVVATEFRELHGHAAIPAVYRYDPRLGEWAGEQRAMLRARQSGRESSLDDEKISELNSIGFVWDEPSQEVYEEVHRVAATQSLMMVHAQHDHTPVAAVPPVADHHHVMYEEHHEEVNEEISQAAAQAADAILRGSNFVDHHSHPVETSVQQL